MTSYDIRQQNIAVITSRLISLEEQREMIEARGNLDAIEMLERKIGQALDFLEAITKNLNKK